MKKIIGALVIITTVFVGTLSNVYATSTFEKTPFNGVIVAEACGSYDGIKAVNSKQALEKSVSDGYKLIEVDVSITKDNKPVCINRWSKKTLDKLGLDYSKNDYILSYEEYMNSKLCGKYTPLDVEMLYQYINNFYDERIRFRDGVVFKMTETQFIIDFGEIKDKWDTYKCHRSFYKEFQRYYDLLTFKIYNETMYEGMNGYSNYMYVIDSKTDAKNIDKILEFCSDKNFMSIQIKNDFIRKNIVDKCHKYGLQVVSTTTNSEKKAKKLLGLGVDCIATNTIKPDFGETTEK